MRGRGECANIKMKIKVCFLVASLPPSLTPFLLPTSGYVHHLVSHADVFGIGTHVIRRGHHHKGDSAFILIGEGREGRREGGRERGRGE